MIRSNKMLVLFSLTAVLLLLTSSWFVRDRLKHETKLKVEESLKTVLETTRQAVRSWLKEQRSAVMAWANSPEVLKAVEAHLSLTRDKDGLITSPARRG